MKTTSILILSLSAGMCQADPQLFSRYTEDWGQYARLDQSTANETSRTVSKT